ncbi:hypothetical protein DID88_010090 [Monilinia fructigena]|uniref:Uncharacterized protein n=1 Tax=Monilinia fructigena TaxID=38457 RepID=A0A395IM90_9HELO|nr:hypothetical protein DID88_010090 [Monilinia fructigena]
MKFSRVQKALFFSSAGRFTWKLFAEYAGEALFKRGLVLKQEQKVSVLKNLNTGWLGVLYMLSWLCSKPAGEPMRMWLKI